MMKKKCRAVKDANVVERLKIVKKALRNLTTARGDLVAVVVRS